MGVKLQMCDRDGCYNSTADLWSDEYGYLCRDCLEELIDFITHLGRFDTAEIWEFMHRKPDFKTDFDARRLVLEEFTRER